MPFGGGGGGDAEDAAEAQVEGLEKAIQAQKQFFRIGRRDLAPYRKQGYEALNMLGQMYGLPPITRQVVSNKWKKWRNQGGETGGGDESGSDAAAAAGPQGEMSMGEWLEFINSGTGRENTRDTGAFGENIPGMVDGPHGGGGGEEGTGPPKKFRRKTMTEYGDVGEMIRNQPGYQFRLGEGLRGVGQSAAARGSLYGGGQLRELTRYGQNYASNEFDKVASRLSQIAGLGGGAAGQSANIGAATGQGIASSQAGIGTARASGYAGAGGGNSGMGTVFGIAGGIAGAYFGGPAGAAAGYSLGSSLGSRVGS